MNNTYRFEYLPVSHFSNPKWVEVSLMKCRWFSETNSSPSLSLTHVLLCSHSYVILCNFALAFVILQSRLAFAFLLPALEWLAFISCLLLLDEGN